MTVGEKLEFEKAPKEVVERLARLEEHRQYVATETDIARLEGRIDNSVEELKGFFQTSITELRGEIKASQSQGEVKTLKLFLGLCVVLVGIISPLISGLVLHALTSP